MVLLKSFSISILILTVLASCTTPSCQGGLNQFILFNWTKEDPSTVTIKLFKKNSYYTHFEKEYATKDLDIFISHLNKTPDLYLSPLNGSAVFPYDSDYLITINNKYEYRVNSIVPGFPYTGCLLKEGKVNNRCDVEGHSYTFDSRCANLVQE
ncbi:MAG TPA: hypothetical protein VIH57_03895 [Bacteroidales bacterium]